MKNRFQPILIVALLILSSQMYAQVGIGTNTPNNSAALHLESSNKGVLIPRLSQMDRTNITPTAIIKGMLVYQTDNAQGFWYCDGTAWIPIVPQTGWGLEGNAGANPATHKLGTTDDTDVVFRVNNTEVARLSNEQYLGIGAASPTNRLHLEDSNPSFTLQDGNQQDGRYLVSDANGNATWADVGLGTNGADDDWQFYSGNTINDDIFRTGKTAIGNVVNAQNSRPFIADLDVINFDNAFTTDYNNSGTELGIGSDEYHVDDPSEFFMSHNFGPRVNASLNLGKSSLRWMRIYALNHNIGTSDRRFKKDIKPLKYGAETLNQLNPVTYFWNRKYMGETPIKDSQKFRQLGFIAQELQEVIPEMVMTEYWKVETPELYKKTAAEKLGVRFSEMIPVVVSAVKENQTTIEKIKAKQTEMLNKLDN